MVMGVDQAGQQHVAAGIEHCVAGEPGRAAARHQLGDAPALDDDAALMVRVEAGERVSDPERHGVSP